VFYSRDPEGNERHLNDFLRGVSTIGIDQETCKICGRERGQLRAQRKGIGDFDLMIGATALRHNLTLLTNNRRHFGQIEGLAKELGADTFRPVEDLATLSDSRQAGIQ
jgi:predicted nucleic acid-binding protein